ncbi:hypothetical protein [Paenibacillus glycanilyticus]|uniref:Uncharacterized protein n=1 Tax=Paenibacillus glycanilyticus TaxID=126569 RepID=A0ABQ6GB38_9BACL|nr:hypothetical protein [Paenibacillus glycanilyticus]GLX68179.1 hypothetical protein MU1_25240 [Paenibacillus glycanilyticus]
MLSKIMKLSLVMLLVCSPVVYAGDEEPFHSELKNLAKQFEQITGQSILLPTWLPKNYVLIDAGIFMSHHLDITYSRAQKRDGSIALHIYREGIGPSPDSYFSKITLKNGRTAYLNEIRREGPFDNIPIEGSAFELYFYDHDLLYTLNTASDVIDPRTLRKNLIKIATSMDYEKGFTKSVTTVPVLEIETIPAPDGNWTYV